MDKATLNAIQNDRTALADALRRLIESNDGFGHERPEDREHALLVLKNHGRVGQVETIDKE